MSYTERRWSGRVTWHGARLSGAVADIADALVWRCLSLAQAMRELWGNGPPAPPDAQLPLHDPVLATILWSLALTAIFAPFALRAYARRTGD